MFSLLWYVFIWWDLLPTSPWGKLHPVPTAMLIVTLISIMTHSVLKTQFPCLNINCFQCAWFRSIIIESGIFLWWMSRGPCLSGGRGGLHVFKERGISRREGWKKKGGGLIHLPALWFEIVHLEKTDQV